MPPELRRDRRLGEFRIDDEIGRGGMGVVFRARQASLGRDVALKVLPSHISLNEGALTRFRREAVTAGRLNHPAIAKVYSVGEDQGLHYFAMELVDGPSLEDCLDRVRSREPSDFEKSLLEEAGLEAGDFVPPSPQLPYFAALAAWTAEVADALTCAHRARVLHRDVKPSNILLRPDASPVLVDFGLSRDNLAADLTRTGDAVGTPAYMSPEQARGETRLDDRVDVYGLGATLYELVTLVPPFHGKHPTQIMQRILEEDPVDPCKRNTACPRDLANIILKCLAKTPDDRYRDARSLAQDLRRFLRGEDVEAHPPSARARLKRGLARRRRSIVASAVTAIVVLVLGAGLVRFEGGLQERAGERALGEALDALAAGRENDAIAAFARAQQVLGDDRVEQPWLAFLGRRAENLERQESYRRIGDLYRTYARPYLSKPEVRRWLEVARGTGTLRLDVVPPGAEVRLQFLDAAGAPAGEPLPYRPGARVGCGDWIVHAGAGEDRVPARAILRVVRDREVHARLRAPPKTTLRPGTVYVAGNGRDVPPFLIDRTEVTNRDYAAFLAALPPQRRSAFVPREGWKDGRPPADGLDRPVRSLPFAAALSYACFHGGHIPSGDEFATAGSLGGPWPYPWGPHFDPERVVADPGHLTHPLAVGTRTGGTSGAGCVDLVGNVAEWVTGPGDRVFARGGGFASAASALRLDRGRRLVASRPYPDVGFRVAYYLAPAAGETGGGRVLSAWRKRRDLGLAVARTEVRVDWTGHVGLAREVAGTIPRPRDIPPAFLLPGGYGFYEPVGRARLEATPGMRVVPLEAGIRAQRFEPAMEAALRENGGRFRFRVAYDRVLPRQILVPLGGGRFLHRFLVLRRPLESELHRLCLPGRARVHRTSPEADEQDVEGGDLVLSFAMPARPGDRVDVVPIEVEFSMDRRDDPVPSPDEVHGVIADFCAAWNEGDADRLYEITDERFTFGPRGLRRGQILPALRRAAHATSMRQHARDAHFQLDEDPVIEAVGAFGRAVRVVAVLSAGDDGEPERLLFTLVRTPQGFRVLDLTPPVLVDTSDPAAGGLRNRRVGIFVPRPPSFAAVRLGRFPAPLQVRLDRVRPVLSRRPGRSEEAVSFDVLLLGARLDASRTAEVFRARLLRDTFPLYANTRLSDDPIPVRIGRQVEGRAEMVYLSRPWMAALQDRTMLQKRVTFEHDGAVFLVIATASARTGGPEVLRAAWRRFFAKELDDLLRSIRFD